ncbi:MAG: rod shape-determining protein RodA [Actinobacteria bacterium]|jgi:rod shape determining protein RodA|nr:rod shape-determining protein RodA [Actinomycetota bacterium]
MLVDRSKGWRQTLLHFDFTLFAVTVSTAFLGVIMVYSATREKLILAGLNRYSYLEHQAVYVLIGIVVMFVIVTIDYHQLGNLGFLAYGAIVMALLGVLTPIGKRALGSQRWYQLGPVQFQPSEFAALAIILAIAAYLQAHQDEELDAKMLVKILVMAGFPMLLVIKQPDIGTALVMGSVLLTMLVLAKVPLKWLAVLFLLGALAIVAILSLGILQKYQLQRLTSFVNPKTSALQAGYNLAQSKIAIGSGGLFGTGIFHGPQTNLSYVPEQQTDFIFTAVGEQLGFVGAGGLLLAYAYMVWRVWCIMKRAKDPLGRMLAGGVLGLLAFSIFQNAGMTMGIMPITGIPLPFMSYGGSAVLAFFASIGLVLNVGMRNPK